MLSGVIQELEHELDRSVLYNDPMPKGTLEVSLRKWISELQDAEADMAEEAEKRGSVMACLDHDAEIKSLREAVATLEEKIRQAKEIL